MSYPFDLAETNIENALQFYAGMESFIAEMDKGKAPEAKTYQEHYALLVLENHCIDIKNIAGAEGLAASAGNLLYKAIYEVGLKVQQYAALPVRFAFSKVKTALLKSTYMNKSTRELAKNSIFSPEQIVAIIKDPQKEKAKVKKIEERTNKGNNKTYGFKDKVTALYPIIALAENSKTNGALVEKAISSAGSIDKLIRKHANVADAIVIDKNPYIKLYDVMSKEKGEVIDSIIKRLDGIEKDLKSAESVLTKDSFLLTFPSSLKTELKTIKGFSNDVSFLSDHFLNHFLLRLGMDTTNFNRIVKTTKGNEEKVAAAARLVKVYVGIAESIMHYNLKLNKAENYANSISAEALYKIIIAAAKAEVKA